MKRGSGCLLVMGLLGGCMVPGVDEFREERTQSCGQSFTCPHGLSCQDGFCVGSETGSELCTPTCAEHQFCASSSRSCMPRYSKLTLLEPKNSVYYIYNGSPVTVPIKAMLQLAEGAPVKYPSSLTLYVTNSMGQSSVLSTNPPQDGLYSASWTASAKNQYLLRVIHKESGLQDNVNFIVDYGR